MQEIVEDHRTGLHFAPGDAQDLAQTAEWAWNHPKELMQMGRAARRKYERDYTAEKNYSLLMRSTNKPWLPMSSFQASCAIPSYKVLGVPVHCVEISGVIKEIESWIADARPTRYVAITGMHGVSESRKDEQFREILKEADLVVPDGMPLIWLANWHRHPMHQRVSGTELLEGFCQTTGSRYRHFFYGGAPGVADDLAQHLSHRFGIVVAGTYTPPFQPLTRERKPKFKRAWSLRLLT